MPTFVTKSASPPLRTCSGVRAATQSNADCKSSSRSMLLLNRSSQFKASRQNLILSATFACLAPPQNHTMPGPAGRAALRRAYLYIPHRRGAFFCPCAKQMQRQQKTTLALLSRACSACQLPIPGRKHHSANNARQEILLQQTQTPSKCQQQRFS